MIFLIFFAIQAFASEQMTFLDPDFSGKDASDSHSSISTRSQLSGREIYRRTQIVLHHFQVPEEPDFRNELNAIRGNTKADTISDILAALDPTKQFNRFFQKTSSDSSLKINSFRDRDAKELAEYEVSFPTSSLKTESIRGFRVALDPGHLGGDVWDNRTGKFVKDSDGVKVSEGMLNLEAALLIEKKLQDQGAIVMITHRGIGPVTTMSYDDLDLDVYAKREIRMKSLTDWFQDLLTQANDSSLGDIFASYSKIKKLFSENARSDYFAMREDLYARQKAINDFRPDVTIMIHFDADQAGPSSAKNYVRSYVPGSFGADEFATSEARAHFLSHIAQGDQWLKSVDLSKKIVNEISHNLNVPLMENDMAGTTPIAPGVFARNLALTRLLTRSPLAYLECLRYGNSQEFYRMAKDDGGVLSIDGKEISYSARLKMVADSIANGIIQFASSSVR